MEKDSPLAFQGDYATLACFLGKGSLTAFEDGNRTLGCSFNKQSPTALGMRPQSLFLYFVGGFPLISLRREALLALKGVPESGITG